MMVLSACSVIAFRKISVAMSSSRLKNLAREESEIAKLMKDTQRKVFEEKTISSSEYYRLMAQYDAQLRKIRIARAKIRARRAGAISLKEEIKNIETESEEVLGLIKKAQDNYFRKGTISKEKYEDEKEAGRVRLAEIEEAKALLKARIMEEKAGNYKKVKNK